MACFRVHVDHTLPNAFYLVSSDLVSTTLVSGVSRRLDALLILAQASVDSANPLLLRRHAAL